MDKTFSPYRKRLNTEIMKKTQIALQVIKNHDVEQSRLRFYNNFKFSPSKMLSEIQTDYNYLFPSKKIQLQKTYIMNLFAHEQEFYYLPMQNYTFPIRIFLKNVQNEGVLFVGYDRQHPGVKKEKKDKHNQIDHETQSDNLFDYTAIINKEQMITLKNKENKNVNVIYFTFLARSSILMFRFKIDSLGFDKQMRSFSETKLKMPRMKLDQSLDKSREQILIRQNTEPIPISRPSNILLPSISKQSQKSAKVEQLKVSNQKAQSLSKQTFQIFNKTLGATKILKTTKLFTQVSLQKSKFTTKLEEVKKNRSLLQVYKQKDKQLRETSSRCKKLIENYKRIYNEQNVRKSKLNKTIVLTLYSMLYINSFYKQYFGRKKQLSHKEKKHYLCKRFIKKLRDKVNQSANMIFPRGKRLNFQSHSTIILQAKLIEKHSSFKAGIILKQTLQSLKPIFSINRSLVTSAVYRDKIKFIQRVWKIKYSNRMFSLLYFTDNFVEELIKQYPHFKLFFEPFYKKGANREVCLNYLKDQSLKYRYIYKNYLKKLQEIQQIKLTIKTSPEKKNNKKEKLIVPKKPIKPLHRFYRNCDILKSMVRTWFEIEYKKYCKKNIHIPK